MSYILVNVDGIDPTTMLVSSSASLHTRPNNRQSSQQLCLHPLRSSQERRRIKKRPVPVERKEKKYIQGK